MACKEITTTWQAHQLTRRYKAILALPRAIQENLKRSVWIEIRDHILDQPLAIGIVTGTVTGRANQGYSERSKLSVLPRQLGNFGLKTIDRGYCIPLGKHRRGLWHWSLWLSMVVHFTASKGMSGDSVNIEEAGKSITVVYDRVNLYWFRMMPNTPNARFWHWLLRTNSHKVLCKHIWVQMLEYWCLFRKQSHFLEILRLYTLQVVHS